MNKQNDLRTAVIDFLDGYEEDVFLSRHKIGEMLEGWLCETVDQYPSLILDDVEELEEFIDLYVIVGA